MQWREDVGDSPAQYLSGYRGKTARERGSCFGGGGGKREGERARGREIVGKDMEYGGGEDGEDRDASSDPQGSKKRYHRPTTHQIQRLEAMFKECPHPDEKQRSLLSRDLGLAPPQIKFWFQNRRTQMKAQHKRVDNCALRVENDKIRCENIAIQEALRNVISPSCRGPPVNEDSYFDEQKL